MRRSIILLALLCLGFGVKGGPVEGPADGRFGDNDTNAIAVGDGVNGPLTGGISGLPGSTNGGEAGANVEYPGAIELDIPANITNIAASTAEYPTWDYSERFQVDAGSALDWFDGGAADAKCVTIPATGVYDMQVSMDWSLVSSNASIQVRLAEDPGCDQVSVDANVGSPGAAVWHAAGSKNAGPTTQRQLYQFRGMSLTAGDEITVQIIQRGSTSNTGVSDTAWTYWRIYQR